MHAYTKTEPNTIITEFEKRPGKLWRELKSLGAVWDFGRRTLFPDPYFGRLDQDEKMKHNMYLYLNHLNLNVLTYQRHSSLRYKLIHQT